MHSSGIKNLVIHLENVFKNIPLSAISGYELFYGFGFLSVIKDICLILRSLVLIPLILLSVVCITTVHRTGVRSHVPNMGLWLWVGVAANPAPIHVLS